MGLLVIWMSSEGVVGVDVGADVGVDVGADDTNPSVEINLASISSLMEVINGRSGIYTLICLTFIRIY